MLVELFLSWLVSIGFSALVALIVLIRLASKQGFDSYLPQELVPTFRKYLFLVFIPVVNTFYAGVLVSRYVRYIRKLN